MNEQLQSVLFKLPPELRDSIYQQFLLNGQRVQHIQKHQFSDALTRTPCHTEADHCVLPRKLSSNSALARQQLSLWSTRPFRNGHLSCPEDWQQLPGPTSLFRTCRKVYVEASAQFYSFHFLYFDEFLEIMGPEYLGWAADRFTRVECACPIQMRDLHFEDFRQKLHLFKHVKHLKLKIIAHQYIYLEFLPDNKDESDGSYITLVLEGGQQRLHPMFQELLLEIGCRNIEVEIFNLGSNQKVFSEGLPGTKSMVICWRPESPWIYGLGEILKDGIKGLDRVQEKYAQKATRQGS
ncbi:putative F-box domain-containing protein [Seiridium cardinale]|uniref:F-box domain-containing protein n=1 Tax=Seiridium cardinale TaxID=138064 RepID=A0ABR2XAZ8_9PEZI